LISRILGALVAPFFILTACTPQSAPVETAAPVEKSVTVEAPKKIETELVALVNPTAADLQRGAKVYKANCVRCHNADPNLKGSIGPQQVDAPFEVVVAKVMTGKYPDPLPQGFVPKRKTKAMTPLKNVKNDIPYIHAWIQSVKRK
jgi:mono/diheme cytochrome c family protein